MAGRVEGKVAVVIGGGSDMGGAGSMLLAAEGAKVVIADMNAEKGSQVADAIVKAGYDAIFHLLDVRKRQEPSD